MLEVHDHGAVRELRLARAPVNALDAALLSELGAQVERAPGAGAAALVISGRPGMFSAGLDVRALLACDKAALTDFWRLLFHVQEMIARSSVPVIMAITGHCPAGGTVLALHGDYRIMAQGSFVIGLNEVQLGLFPGTLVYRAYERLVGARCAAELLLRGALLDPLAAQQVGLVDELCAPAEVIPRALAYARGLLALPPRAFARTRELVRADLLALFDALQPQVFEDGTATWLSEETQARVRGLLERR
ncbi:MAG TPA: enoyl-CoA hydratase/isomerase family protein [Steroidobacteraceae bacterium]